MLRFIITLFVLISLVAGNLFLLACNDSAQQSISAPSDAPKGPELPECCRNGFCPHHSHAEAPPAPKSDDCTCGLFSDDHGSLTISQLSPATAPVCPDGVMVAEFGMAGATVSNNPTVSYQVPPTPPPKV